MVGHGFAEGSSLHWNASSTSQCGGSDGNGCADPMPSLPPNLNGSLLTPEFSFLRVSGGAPAGDAGWKIRDDVWVVFNESAADDGLGPDGPWPKGDSGYWRGGPS